MQQVTVDRGKYIGGSDIPIIMGISPFKSRFDLLLEKAGLKENDFTGNEYTEYGNILESKIRDYINNLYETNFIEDKVVKDDVRCHFDGAVKIENNKFGTILEIKTTSQIHENVNDYKVYLVQLLFYMLHAECKNGVLAVYERPQDFSEEFDNNRLTIYTIDLDDYKDLIEKINKAVEQFRIDLEKVQENPLITEEELLPSDLTELLNIVIGLENELKQYDELVKRRDMFKEKLRQIMIDTGTKGWETPNGIKITNVPDGEDKEVQKFNETKFKEENENLYNQYLEPKIQKGRKGSLRITIPKNDDGE